MAYELFSNLAALTDEDSGGDHKARPKLSVQPGVKYPDTLKAAQELEKQLTEVRTKKINKLKEKIASGKYDVNNLRLAKSLFLAR